MPVLDLAKKQLNWNISYTKASVMFFCKDIAPDNRHNIPENAVVRSETCVPASLARLGS